MVVYCKSKIPRAPQGYQIIIIIIGIFGLSMAQVLLTVLVAGTCMDEHAYMSVDVSMTLGYKYHIAKTLKLASMRPFFFLFLNDDFD